MLTENLRHGPIIVLAVLGALLAAGDLTAQDPKLPTPTPVIPPTKPAPIQPIERPPGAEPTLINPGALQKPDLQLTLSPQSMNAAPSTFTVKNTGPVSATGASLLRVTVELLPLEGIHRRDLLPGRDDTERGVVRTSPEIQLGGILGGGPSDQLTASEFADLCAPPLDDFEAAIGPLGMNETEVVSQSGTRVSGDIRDVGLVAARPSVRIPTHSYVREIEVRLVCVYELRASVDANREIQELSEANNEVIHIFQREVTLR